MKYLTIVRHAEAEPLRNLHSDFERSLTECGISEARPGFPENSAEHHPTGNADLQSRAESRADRAHLRRRVQYSAGRDSHGHADLYGFGFRHHSGHFTLERRSQPCHSVRAQSDRRGAGHASLPAVLRFFPDLFRLLSRIPGGLLEKTRGDTSEPPLSEQLTRCAGTDGVLLKNVSGKHGSKAVSLYAHSSPGDKPPHSRTSGTERFSSQRHSSRSAGCRGVFPP